jgi:hypothetical protein
MHDKLTSEIHQNAAWLYRVIKYGAHFSMFSGHTTASTMTAASMVTFKWGKQRNNMQNLKWRPASTSSETVVNFLLD